MSPSQRPSQHPSKDSDEPQPPPVHLILGMVGLLVAAILFEIFNK